MQRCEAPILRGGEERRTPRKKLFRRMLHRKFKDSKQCKRPSGQMLCATCMYFIYFKFVQYEMCNNL